MKKDVVRTGRKMDISIIAVGILVLAYAVLFLAGRLSFMSDKAALLGFLVVGMTMCTLGMKFEKYGWTNPFNVIGIILGVIILLLALAALLGIRLHYLTTVRDYFLAILLIVALKVAVAIVRDLINK